MASKIALYSKLFFLSPSVGISRLCVRCKAKVPAGILLRSVWMMRPFFIYGVFSLCINMHSSLMQLNEMKPWKIQERCWICLTYSIQSTTTRKDCIWSIFLSFSPSVTSVFLSFHSFHLSFLLFCFPLVTRWKREQWGWLKLKGTIRLRAVSF